MQRESLVGVLKDASGSTADRDGVFTFEASLALLVATGGTVLSIERVQQVTLKKDYLIVQTDRSERYFLEPEGVVAVRLHGGIGKSGFVSPTDR